VDGVLTGRHRHRGDLTSSWTAADQAGGPSASSPTITLHRAGGQVVEQVPRVWPGWRHAPTARSPDQRTSATSDIELKVEVHGPRTLEVVLSVLTARLRPHSQPVLTELVLSPDRRISGWQMASWPCTHATRHRCSRMRMPSRAGGYRAVAGSCGWLPVTVSRRPARRRLQPLAAPAAGRRIVLTPCG